MSVCSVMLVIVLSDFSYIATSHGETVYKRVDGIDIPHDLVSGHKWNTRQQRAIIYKLRSATVNGMRATISLLRDAKRLPSSDKNMLKFQKFGSYDQTVTDFFSVRPRDVKEFYTQSGGQGLFGDVGDRTILVQKMDRRSGKPILKIIRDLPSGGQHIQQITYIE